MKPLFDTNVLIDYLLNVEEARAELSLYRQAAISVISWMEVMAGARPDNEQATRRFLNRFDRIGLDAQIAERAVAVRRERRIKLPDAIIWATANCGALMLVTRNSKDFPAGEPWVRIPYSRR